MGKSMEAGNFEQLQREPTNAIFQRSWRRMGGAAGRSGSGRRGGSKGMTPRHLR